MPVKPIVCGLPVASSAILIVAVRVPVALGVNVTLIVHVPPFAATDVPQLSVLAKSPPFVPLMVMLVMFKTAVPLLVKVTGWADDVVPTNCPLNVRDVLPNTTAGAIPVPVKPIVCGLPVALSAMLIVAVRVPVALGVNVTLI